MHKFAKFEQNGKTVCVNIQNIDYLSGSSGKMLTEVHFVSGESLVLNESVNSVLRTIEEREEEYKTNVFRLRHYLKQQNP